MMATVKYKRFCQFSLRTLFWFVTLCALPCSWFAVKMQEARRQRESVEAIRKLGGQVRYDYEITEARNPAPPGPAWLRDLVGIDFVANIGDVVLCKTQVTDAGLSHLDRLTKLQALWLHDTNVTDAGLEHLKGLTQLRVLSLSEHTTDAGLEHLKGLTKLKTLFIYKTALSERLVMSSGQRDEVLGQTEDFRRERPVCADRR